MSRMSAPTSKSAVDQEQPSTPTPSQAAAGPQPSSPQARGSQHAAASSPASTSSPAPRRSGLAMPGGTAGKRSVLSAAAAVLVAAGVVAALKLLRRGHKPSLELQPVDGEKSTAKAGDGKKNTAKAVKGPCSGMKSTSKSVPLADGSACVVRRVIPADNSCLFNAVGYVMHHSKAKASFLRSVVAREVSSDPVEYSDVFLGMSNVAYCSWIMDRGNWGGGIELSILAKHYGREISAWNIESATQLVFGEEAGYLKQVLLIYNGVHYDALAISPGPRAAESEDTTEFNPRTKRGKMIIAAAQKLVTLTHKGKKFVAGSSSTKLLCGDCNQVFSNQKEATKHAQSTGHTHFEQVK